MQYQEPETVLVEVSAEKGSTYSISGEEYDALLERFFRMDEIAGKSRQKPGLLRKTAKISGKVKVGLEIQQRICYTHTISVM